MTKQKINAQEKKKEVFIKGRQSTLDHVLKLLSNIIAFSRFWTGYDPHTKKDLPLIAKIFTDIANELSTSDYQEFHTKYEYIHKHMAHTLVTYIFNIFSQFANASKNPTNLRELKVNNAIDKSLFEIPVYMSVELIRNLRLTKITTQLGNLFTTPTLTYSLFFPKNKTRIIKETNDSLKKMKINKNLTIMREIIMVIGKTDSKKR